MLFNSYIFIFVFLPLTLCGYYGLHRLGSPVLAKIELILMSFWFYGYFNPSYLWIMCSSILVNYVLSQLLQKKWEISGKKLQMLKNSLLCVGLFFKLGLIFYFKQISYMVDSWRGETKEYNFVDYALFVTFFPQLIAGPIVLHNEILPQFEDKKNWKIQWDNLAHGAYIFAAGLVKKVVIADTLSSAVAWGYGHLGRNLTSAEAIITMLAYTFQIYFDFSGYCDMATGLGYLFNIHIPMNFNSPYKATSVVDFWKRWHLTLTRFLRTYVYFPLGGSRKGEVRTYINIIAVFLVSGLWHGANWTFILWGFLHGMGNALTRMFRKQWGHLHTVIQWGITFLFVNLTWIFFRADSISQAVNFIRRIFGFQSFSVRDGLLNTFGLKEWKFIYCHIPILNRVIASVHGFDMLILLTASLILCLVFQNNQEMEFKPDTKKAVFTVLCLIWGIFSLSGVSEFLYFNF